MLSESRKQNQRSDFIISSFQQQAFEKFRHSDPDLSPDMPLGSSANPGVVPFCHVGACRIVCAGPWGGWAGLLGHR